MLKDIIKLAKQNGISYKKGMFRYQFSEISFEEFVRYVNQKKFYIGLNNSIEQAKKELFHKKDFS